MNPFNKTKWDSDDWVNNLGIGCLLAAAGLTLLIIAVVIWAVIRIVLHLT